ncbi:MAG: N-acetylmuramoyl-L-alanine amidase [Clostridia bacterium]|nr:N-acetylmuramoyl-L-alanine amidase [Clostridia bacterium]
MINLHFTHHFSIYIKIRYFAISLCFLVLCFGVWLDTTQVSTAVIAPEQFHVVLDAGHGGHDNGACVEGISEANLNLQIVKILEQELRNHGCAVSLTRTDSESLNSPYAKNKKVDDMTKRREKIRNLNPDLVISIHLNSYSLTSVNGLQCFYANETAGSQEYATAIQNQFNQSGLPIYRSAKPTDFNLVEHSPCPAVLIECGFLTNPRERKLLQTTTYQQILAYNITVAVVNQANQCTN